MSRSSGGSGRQAAGSPKSAVLAEQRPSARAYLRPDKRRVAARHSGSSRRSSSPRRRQDIHAARADPDTRTKAEAIVQPGIRIRNRLHQPGARALVGTSPFHHPRRSINACGQPICGTRSGRGRRRSVRRGKPDRRASSTMYAPSTTAVGRVLSDRWFNVTSPPPWFRAFHRRNPLSAAWCQGSA